MSASTSKRPPRSVQGRGAGRQAQEVAAAALPPPPQPKPSSSSPRHEAEVASFLLQLKHHSPAPSCRRDNHGAADDYDDDSHGRKDPYQSHRYNDGSPSSTYGPMMTPLTNRSQPHVLYSSPAVAGGGAGGGALGISPPWDVLLNQSTLVFLKDRDLVPDALFVAMAQMVPCRLTPSDRVGCYKTRPIGYLGLCCGHCGGQPGFGRYYPNSVRSLAQTTTSQTILKHVTAKCRYCPDDIRRAVLDLQRMGSEENSPVGRPRYGSRKIFFQRIWHRLHQHDGASSSSSSSSSVGPSSSSASSCCCDDEGEEEATTTTVASSVTSRSGGRVTKLTLNQSASNDTPSDLDEEQSLATFSNDTIDDASATFSHRGKGVAWGCDPQRHQVQVTSPVHRLTAD